ncbi:MAG: hypothetical protein REJ23_15815 [Brevundimonas sp.]|nr:hypothetical protein [Brevundimonas sp.]
MRVEALTIGLVLTAAVSGCGERTSQAEFAAVERADRMNDQERRATLTQQVASGEKTSEEAACDYRLGLWDTDRETCFNRDDPSILPAQTGPSDDAAVSSAGDACAKATAMVTGQRGLPIRHVAYCDQIDEADGRPGYYVMGLRAHCFEDLCGSTLMGWFAVEKVTGNVFEVDDVAEWTLGQRVGANP